MIVSSATASTVTVDGRSAVDKALMVLTALNASEVPLKLTELSHRTRLAKTTVHRMLSTLLAHGMIVRTGNSYVAARAVAEPASSAVSRLMALLKYRSTPFLLELHQLTGHTASVSLLIGRNAHQVNQIFDHHSPRLPPGSAVGSRPVLEAVELVLRAHRPDSPGETDGGLDSLELCHVRRAGFAHTDCPQENIASIAVPVAGTLCPVALAVTGSRDRFNVLYAALLRRHAFALSRALREPGPRDGFLACTAPDASGRPPVRPHPDPLRDRDRRALPEAPPGALLTAASVRHSTGWHA